MRPRKDFRDTDHPVSWDRPSDRPAYVNSPHKNNCNRDIDRLLHVSVVPVEDKCLSNNIIIFIHFCSVERRNFEVLLQIDHFDVKLTVLTPNSPFRRQIHRFDVKLTVCVLVFSAGAIFLASMQWRIKGGALWASARGPALSGAPQIFLASRLFMAPCFSGPHRTVLGGHIIHVSGRWGPTF